MRRIALALTLAALSGEMGAAQATADTQPVVGEAPRQVPLLSLIHI